MKFMLSLCTAILCAALLLSVFPLQGEEEIYSRTIRLHVLAESDSAEDQARKLRVRDAVLQTLTDTLRDTDSYPAALSAVENALTAITESATAAAERECAVQVTLGREWYPVRYYENFALPAGEYTSLRIILGEGAGKNWWCVLFPQLCTAHATEDELYEKCIAAGFSSEQYQLIRKESGAKYKIRFRILEILEELFPSA